MDKKDYISLIALILSVIAYLKSDGFFLFRFIRSDITVRIRDEFSSLFLNDANDENIKFANKLHLIIPNYANRDLLLWFKSGYIQYDDKRIDICENQHISLKANSENDIYLSVEPYRCCKSIFKRKLILKYKFGNFIPFIFLVFRFDVIDESVVFKDSSRPSIRKTQLFGLHETIHCNNPLLIGQCIQIIYNTFNRHYDYISVQDITYNSCDDNDNFDIRIKLQLNCQRADYYDLYYNLIEDDFNAYSQSSDIFKVLNKKLVGLDDIKIINCPHCYATVYPDNRCDDSYKCPSCGQIFKSE